MVKISLNSAHIPACIVLMVVTMSMSARSAVLTSSEGKVTITQGGADSAGALNQGKNLPAQTIVSTGEDGKALLGLVSGITAQLQPDTKLAIGDTDVIKINGNDIPQARLTLDLGSVVIDTSGAGAPGGVMTSTLVVMTARGSVIPLTAGTMVITSTGSDPMTATVTVSAVGGEKSFTTTEGEVVDIKEGFVGIFRPDGNVVMSIMDYNNSLRSQAQQPAQQNVFVDPPPDPVSR
ncbi:MAG: hypothetical protein WCI38_00170 [Chthoniobacterales bacterium]|jgi:hypothetical protein